MLKKNNFMVLQANYMNCEKGNALIESIKKIIFFLSLVGKSH